MNEPIIPPAMDPPPPPPPALANWPVHTLHAFQSPYCRNIALRAVAQYIAGMVAKPHEPACTTEAVKVHLLSHAQAVEVSYIFHLPAVKERPDATDWVLVRLVGEVPLNGQVNETTALGPATLYAWDGREWAEVFDYEHQFQPGPTTPLALQDPPTWPTPGP